jgi:NAD(P)H-dependent FMN reductase
MTKLIFLSGSIRKDSLNTKLAQLACKIAAELGANAEVIDLANYEMPIYNGDLEVESGLPENVQKLKEVFRRADGFFIASPEYNSSFSALLKNSLDWISRPSEANEAPLIAFNGKVAAISAASPGGFGGLRGLVPLRMMLGNIGVLVIPNQVALSFASNIFDESGDLKDAKQQKMLKAAVEAFVETSKKHGS